MSTATPVSVIKSTSLVWVENYSSPIDASLLGQELLNDTYPAMSMLYGTVKCKSVSKALDDACRQVKPANGSNDITNPASSDSGSFKYFYRTTKTTHGSSAKTLVKETVLSDSANQYDPVLTVFRSPENDKVLKFIQHEELTGLSLNMLDRLEIYYAAELKTVDPEWLRSSIHGMLRSLNATKLIGLGGWFVPDSSVPLMDEMGQMLGRCGNSRYSKFRIWTQEYTLSGDALDAVRESLTAEVASRIESLTQCVHEGDLSDKKTLQSVEELQKVREKVAFYENVFTMGLDSCRNKIKEVDSVLTVGNAAVPTADTSMMDDMLATF